MAHAETNFRKLVKWTANDDAQHSTAVTKEINFSNINYMLQRVIITTMAVYV